MKKFEIPLVFLCSGSLKSGSKRLSYRIARRLQEMGVASLGDVNLLLKASSHPLVHRRKMIFINDCRGACVKLLTRGFAEDLLTFVPLNPSPR